MGDWSVKKSLWVTGSVKRSLRVAGSVKKSLWVIGSVKKSLWVIGSVKKVESWVADSAEQEQAIKVGRLFGEIREH